MTMDTLYLYTRVSTHQQVDKFSLSVQRDEGIKKAKSLKMNYEVFIEPGKSASHEDLENRPELKKLMDLVEKGITKHIFVIDDSRLSRNMITYFQIQNIFIKNKVITYTPYQKTDYGSIDYQNKFTKDINALLSAFYVSQTTEKSKAGRLKAAIQGKWGGGILPYSYTTDKENNLVIDEKEKKNYLKMVKYSLSGMGAGSIAKKLNELNIPTKGTTSYKKGITLKDKYTGKITFKKREQFIWKQGTIERILKNPLYKGERHYKDEIIKVEPCIDEKTWQKIQDNFQKNKNFSGRHNITHFYLLKGLLFCNRCGKTIIGRIKKDERVYFCMSKRSEEIDFCGMKSINIDSLNKMVWEKFLYVLTNSSVVRKELKKKFANTKENITDINKEINSLNKSLKTKEDEKTNLIRLITQKRISDKEFDKLSTEIENTKNEIINRIKMNEEKIQLSQKEVNTHSWILQIEEKAKELFYLKDEPKKQEILRSFINRINIEWLEKENEHVIQIELKYPLFTDSNFKQEFLLNGTNIDRFDDFDDITLREKYEIENENNDYEDKKNKIETIKTNSSIVTLPLMRECYNETILLLVKVEFYTIRKTIRITDCELSY